MQPRAGQVLGADAELGGFWGSVVNIVFVVIGGGCVVGVVVGGAGPAEGGEGRGVGVGGGGQGVGVRMYVGVV